MGFELVSVAGGRGHTQAQSFVLVVQLPVFRFRALSPQDVRRSGSLSMALFHHISVDDFLQGRGSETARATYDASRNASHTRPRLATAEEDPSQLSLCLFRGGNQGGEPGFALLLAKTRTAQPRLCSGMSPVAEALDTNAPGW